MNSKEKAKDLVDRYKYLYDDDEKLYLHASLNIAKRYALIAVDEIINSIRFTDAKSDLGYVGYWQEVKQEIELL